MVHLTTEIGIKEVQIMNFFLDRKFWRYIVVGGFATSIDIMIFFLLTTVFAVPRYPAFFISFPCGVLVNFILCNKYVFKERVLSLWRSLIRHYAASITGFFMQLLLFFVIVTIFESLSLVIARLFAATCTFIVNFLVIKKFVFGHK